MTECAPLCRLSAGTEVFVHEDRSPVGVGKSGWRDEARLRVSDARERTRTDEDGAGAHSIVVNTSDGEWFPVKRVLLRPCAQLACAHVRVCATCRGPAARPLCLASSRERPASVS